MKTKTDTQKSSKSPQSDFISDILYPNLKTIYVKIALIAVVLAHLASFLGSINEVRTWIFKHSGIEDAGLIHIGFTFLTVLVLLSGYGVLFLWVYSKYIASRAHQKTLVFGVAGLGAVVLCGTDIGLTIPPQPNIEAILKTARTNLINKLRPQQQNDKEKGGFRYAYNPELQDTQVWSTAQAIYPIEMVGRHVSEVGKIIRPALDYTEHLRLPASSQLPHITSQRTLRISLPRSSSRACESIPGEQDGWAYINQLSWSVTEIDSWVALAEIASLRSTLATSLWDKAETVIMVERVKRDLMSIAARQHKDGGWAPIAKTGEETHLRTYSTIMALWALGEARRNTITSGVVGHTFDGAIEKGVQWLADKWIEGDKHRPGWWPNPSLKYDTKYFPGLTAQTLYVLEVITKDSKFLSTDPKIRQAKTEFITWASGDNNSGESLRTKDVADNQSLHDSDRYLNGEPYTVETMTFLWYPWAVAALNELKADDSIPETDRTTAGHLLMSLLRRADEFVQFAQQNPVIYPSAEGLFAIELSLKNWSDLGHSPMVGLEGKLASAGS
jgi:hypothetical protein